MDNVEKKIYALIKEFSFIDDEIKTEDSFAVLGISSISIVDLIAKVEDEFNILFDDSILNPDNFRDVAALVSLVKKSL